MVNTCSVLRHILEGVIVSVNVLVPSIIMTSCLATGCICNSLFKLKMARVNDFFITASPVCTLLNTDVLSTQGLEHNAFLPNILSSALSQQPLVPDASLVLFSPFLVPHFLFKTFIPSCLIVTLPSSAPPMSPQTLTSLSPYLPLCVCVCMCVHACVCMFSPSLPVAPCYSYSFHRSKLEWKR